MTGPAPQVLLLGADGFIGRQIAATLRAEGFRPLCSARRTERLAAMGYETLAADLTDPATHEPSFWRPRLSGCAHVVNAAGLLTGTPVAFAAVHSRAPAAVYAALPPGATGVLISAVGIEADTPFAAARRVGEAVALAAPIPVTLLRPGLVVAETSYGGTSLLRALAAFPVATPVLGRGAQVFNPIHAADLAAIVAACLRAPPPPGPHEVGGPERLTQAELTRALRAWLGLRPVPLLRIPARLARAAGRVGDGLRLGPLSVTTVAQLEAGVEAAPSALAPPPRAFSAVLAARPAATQDLWHARLYLLKPAIRLTLAALWLASGLIGLLTPAAAFLPAFQGLPAPPLTALARLGGLADLALALSLLRDWRPRRTAALQAALVAAYTLGLTLLAPALWLLPFGGLLKNLPVLALIAIHAVLAEER